MHQPLDIRFLGMEPSEAVEAAAREKAAKLDHFCPNLMSCRVTIELLQKHQHQGRPFGVRVDVTLPGHELNVDRAQDEDVYVALRDAFDHIRRQIEDTVRHDRRDEKLHPVPLHGEVVRFEAEGRFGFIRSAAGDDYRFDADSVVGRPFEHVAVGDAVQFIAEVAEQGRQAKRVSFGKHHAA